MGMPTMTDAKMSQDDPTNHRNRLDLSVAQVVASALTVVANAIYLASLHRTRDRLAGLAPAQTGSRATPWPGARDAPWRRIRGRPIPWRAVGIGAVAVFAVLVGLITVVEAA